MPLIDDRSRGNEPTHTPRWPWLMVGIGLATLWAAIALLVSFLPRIMHPPPSAPAMIRQVNAQILQQAQMHSSFGNWSQAAALVRSVDPTQPMSTMDKHTYFRVGSQSLTRTGRYDEAAKYYDRFLSFGTHVHETECHSCHSPVTTVAPLKVADLEKSALGGGYVTALRKSGTLEATRDRLRREWQRSPVDPRLNVLLYHLETATKNSKLAQTHADALAALDR